MEEKPLKKYRVTMRIRKTYEVEARDQVTARRIVMEDNDLLAVKSSSVTGATAYRLK